MPWHGRIRKLYGSAIDLEAMNEIGCLRADTHKNCSERVEENGAPPLRIAIAAQAS
jgi:hypothetical protein